MTVDAEVQKLIDAALAPVKGRLDALETATGNLLGQDALNKAAINALGNRVTALEGAPAPVPVPPPPPVPTPGGVPSPDPALGKVFLWEAKNGMGPFKVLTYPDLHLGEPGQFMTVFNRFTAGRQPTIHDGYLDLQAIRSPTPGLWDADLVGTSQAGNGPTFGYGVTRFWVRYNVGPGTWQTCWLYDTTSWSATEIDWPETLENQHLVAHVLGQGAGSAGATAPADIATAFHEFKIERRAGFVAFSIDGKETGRVNGSMPSSKLAILLDSKVGFAWMGSTGQITSATPNPTYLHVAAVTHDA